MQDTILRTYKYKRYHTVKIDTPNEFGRETAHLYNVKDADNGVKIICGVNCTDGVRISKEDSYRTYKDIKVGDSVMIDDADSVRDGEVHTVTAKGMSIFTDTSSVSYLRLMIQMGTLGKWSNQVKKI